MYKANLLASHFTPSPGRAAVEGLLRLGTAHPQEAPFMPVVPLRVYNFARGVHIPTGNNYKGVTLWNRCGNKGRGEGLWEPGQVMR